MKLTALMVPLTCASLLAAGVSFAHDPMAGEKMKMHGPMNTAQVEKMTSSWPLASRDAIKFLTAKYGAPAAVTPDMAVWGKAGPWKRSIVFRNEVQHKFPKSHTDVMQQWLDYKAPASKYDELAMYDGSVVMERTSGEMSARCDTEAANFLAVNLAHEVATGKRSVEDARKKYGEQIMAMMSKRPAPYTEKVMFSTPGATADADRALPGM